MFEKTSENHDSTTAVADRRQENSQQKASKRAKTFLAANQRQQDSFRRLDKGAAGGQQGSGLERIQNFRVEFGPRKKDIVNFTNQLAVMVRAGISLQDSLESIGEQQTNQKLREIILDLKNQLVKPCCVWR